MTLTIFSAIDGVNFVKFIASEQETFGMLYFAKIDAFEQELYSEIEKIIFVDKFVGEWTYPEIQPKLMEEVRKRGFV